MNSWFVIFACLSNVLLIYICAAFPNSSGGPVLLDNGLLAGMHIGVVYHREHVPGESPSPSTNLSRSTSSSASNPPHPPGVCLLYVRYCEFVPYCIRGHFLFWPRR